MLAGGIFYYHHHHYGNLVKCYFKHPLFSVTWVFSARSVLYIYTAIRSLALTGSPSLSLFVDQCVRLLQNFGAVSLAEIQF